jgi:type I restriction enzyme R subunit
LRSCGPGIFEWKRIEREDEPRRVSLEVMLRGTCDPTRLLDLVENFTLFSEHKAGLAKIIGQNHQMLGVNAAIASLHRIRPDLANPATLTPTPLPEVEGQYRGGLQYSGLVDRARQLRQQQTPAEDIAWELLRDRRFEGLKIRRQHQIGNYIADFCCAEHKLDIEVDGDVHRSPEVVAKDSQRDAYLRSMGYTVLRFQNRFVLDQPEDFLRQIAAAAQLPSTSGRGAGGEGKTTSSNGIGVFWQTQGSGKSFSMVFFAQKVLRKVAGNWTFVVVTDRVELDEQIAKTFKTTGAVSEAEGDQCHAASGAHLRELLRGNHRYVFTLIHKFQTPEMLCDRPDVIVLTDEAHRSRYDTLALNMRAALPKALFLAFTGTPLIAGEERTKDVFGDYVSIYDFQQSVEDGATVPLFYETPSHPGRTWRVVCGDRVWPQAARPSDPRFGWQTGGRLC